MRQPLGTALLGTALFAMSSAGRFAAAEQAGAPEAKLSDLAWIAGRWVDDRDGNLSEEVWTAPSGDTMLGMWRYVAGGKTRVVEILRIAVEDGGPVLRLRHFDRELVGREERTQSVVLRLVEWKRRSARFQGPPVGASGLVTIHYRRPDDDRLVVTLEKEGGREDFAFRRAALE